jgi:protocatechuate 3,4-dioxygenase alpha subunit
VTELRGTPGQTIGPFFGFALSYPRDHELVEPGTPGSIRLHGTVSDGRGNPIPDALLEIWQADADGVVPSRAGSLLRDGTFTGWGRAATDAEGRYWFRTVEPGPTRPERPAFFAVTIFARGLLDRLFTRAYLPADVAVLVGDPLLSGLDDDRRCTLVAVRDTDASLRFDIVLQGERETVFLSYEPTPTLDARAAIAGA